MLDSRCITGNICSTNCHRQRLFWQGQLKTTQQSHKSSALWSPKKDLGMISFSTMSPTYPSRFGNGRQTREWKCWLLLIAKMKIKTHRACLDVMLGPLSMYIASASIPLGLHQASKTCWRTPNQTKNSRNSFSLWSKKSLISQRVAAKSLFRLDTGTSTL